MNISVHLICFRILSVNCPTAIPITILVAVVATPMYPLCLSPIPSGAKFTVITEDHAPCTPVERENPIKQNKMLLSLTKVITLSLNPIRGTSDDADAVGGVFGLDGKYITIAMNITLDMVDVTNIIRMIICLEENKEIMNNLLQTTV